MIVAGAKAVSSYVSTSHAPAAFLDAQSRRFLPSTCEIVQTVKYYIADLNSDILHKGFSSMK